VEGATRERLERIGGKDALIIDWPDYPIAGVVQIQADRVKALFSL
jgi:hypothetical protein